MTKEKLLGLIISWENMELIIHETKRCPQNIPVLMDIALYSKHPKSWRAAWIADKIHDSNPELITPFLVPIIYQLKKESNNSKKRQFLKLISLHDIPGKHYSFLLNYCLNCYTSANEPVSVRVYAMQILYNISEEEPGFKPELLALIEHEIELHPTAGIKSRGKRLTKKLKMQIGKS